MNYLRILHARRMDADGAGGGSAPPAATYTQAQLDEAVSKAVTDREKKLTQEHQQALADKDMDYALRGALTDAHDADLVMGLIDKGKLKLDGGKVEGLEDQLKGLRETKSFLFTQKTPETQPALSGAKPADTGGKPATPDESMAAEVASYFKI